ncbi:MAG: hypothetical protein MI974_20115 [Chitinophagales bacterium]|nr:hypothetical protein [Chitinophagales bacterium]
MELILKLDFLKRKENIYDFCNFFNDSNVYDVKIKIHERPLPGSMSGSEITDILIVILGSTATTITLKGIFDVIKEYIALKKEYVKTKSEEQRISFKTKNADEESELIFHLNDKIDENLVFKRIFDKISNR